MSQKSRSSNKLELIEKLKQTTNDKSPTFDKDREDREVRENMRIISISPCHQVGNSRQEVFCKKDVLRNFTKFTGKHLCRNLLFNKVAGLRKKKKDWHRYFPVNFGKFRRTPLLTEHLP